MKEEGRRRRAQTTIALLGLGALTACGGGATASTSPPATPGYQWHGATLARPVPKPALTLTDDNGQPYDLVARTRGTLTLLYFGYTHCPDACPATMATLTLALRQLPAALSARVTVIFVTTDPARDTPAALKAWLANFNPAFVGLTGSPAQLIAAQTAAHLPVAAPSTPDSSGGYGVEHAAFVLAFSPDSLAHISYPEGVTAANEASDFQELLTHPWQG